VNEQPVFDSGIVAECIFGLFSFPALLIIARTEVPKRYLQTTEMYVAFFNYTVNVLLELTINCSKTDDYAHKEKRAKSSADILQLQRSLYLEAQPDVPTSLSDSITSVSTVSHRCILC
jgi:hypothetical protein